MPPNLHFEVDDFTKEWPHDPNTFNFIHARALYGSINDWPLFLRRAYEALAPGGWFESVETTVEQLCDDGTLKEDSPLIEWARLCEEAGNLRGKPMSLGGKIKPWMEKEGFINTVEMEYKVPIGPWAQDSHLKEIGKYNLLNMLEAMGLSFGPNIISGRMY